MRPLGSPQKLERRRLRAIKLLKEGHPPVEVARIVGCDRRSVRRWNAAYRNGGVDTLKARTAPGRKPKLDEKARLQLEIILRKGAKAAGFSPDWWTCLRVAKLIQRQFGIHYHMDHIRRLLHALGWSPKKIYLEDPSFIGEDGSLKYYPDVCCVWVPIGSPEK